MSGIEARDHYPSTAVQTTVNGSTISESSYSTSKTQETVVHELTDNGAGSLGNHGSVNYAGKTVTVRFVDLSSTSEGYKSDHETDDTFTNESGATTGSSSIKGGEYGDTAISEEVLANATVTVTYAKDFAVEVVSTESFRPPAVTIDLCPYTSDYIVPGSVRFTWMGHVFEDYDGVLFRDRTSSSLGFVAGQINYSEGIATVTDYVVDGPATEFALNSCWTVRQNWTTASVFFRTQAAPLKPTGFVMSMTDTQGNEIVATGDLNGLLTGPHLKGKLDYSTGEGELQFGDYVTATGLTDAEKLEWWYDEEEIGSVVTGKVWRPWPVDPTTLRYNSVSYFYLPMDADLLGLDPVRLPPDGRVVSFRVGSFVVVGHTGQLPAATVSNGQTLNCARPRLSRVRVIGDDGLTIDTGYTANLDAGTVTFNDVAGYSQPVTVEHRIEDMARVSDVQIDGTLGLTRQLSHDYPVGSFVSSALMFGNLRARVSAVWDQSTWDRLTWADGLVGNPAPATYNDTLAPIVVTNGGALTERFAFIFKSSSTFDCVGEHVGFIGEGSINADFSPINPIAGLPYLTVPELGWGSGWSVGNALFVHTVGALAPFACIQTVQPSNNTDTDFSFSLLGRGGVDRP